jgi:hypothetical protein
MQSTQDMLKRTTGRHLAVLMIAVCLVGQILLAAPLGAAAADTNRRYQVVAGTDELAYLVDTTTGSVWVLTYRTLATGREPIAIPYKFIKLSPKNQGEFLLEATPGTSLQFKETEKK